MSLHEADAPASDPCRWTGLEILTVLLLSLGVWGWLAFSLLDSAGLFRAVYGPERAALLHLSDPATAAASVASPTQAVAPDAGVVGGASSVASTAFWADLPSARRLLTYRATLWAAPLTFALQLGTVALIFGTFSGTSLADLGLHARPLKRNVLLGAGAALVLTPAVAGFNALVVLLWKRYQPSAIQEHPFTQLGQAGLSRAEWVLLVCSAVVIAPVWEELLFRGILQPWFAARRHGGLTATLFAVAFSLTVTSDRLLDGLPQGPGALLMALLPTLLVLALVPLPVLLADRPADSALVGTSILFAWIHARAWPTPMALVLLGLALGALARRTGSLVAPITLHSLFNAAACTMLLFGGSA